MVIAFNMAQLLVRNLDDETAQRLKDEAAAQNLSLEQFLRNLLRDAVTPKTTKNDTIRIADAIRAKMKKVAIDPTEIISAERANHHDRD